MRNHTLSKKTLEELENVIKNDNSKSIAFFGWIDDKGKVVSSDCTWCHAGMNRPHVNGIQYSFSKITNMKATNAERKLFIDYMLNDSPWAPHFVNENVEEVLRYGWLISGECDAHLLVNAFVAGRLITEFYDNRFQFFKKAIEHGADKDMAMALSQFCRTSGNKDTSFYLETTPGHGFIYDASTKILRNFINHTPVLKVGSYKTHRSYNRHCDVWDGAGGGYDFGAPTTRIMEKIPVYKSVEKVNLNIFYKEKRMTRAIYHDFKSIPYFTKKIMENLVA